MTGREPMPTPDAQRGQDHFAALGLEPAAAVDEDEVRARFHELSRELHPDTEGGDEARFAAINEAQRVLRSPAARLRHLIELRSGGSPADGGGGPAELTAELMELFEVVGAAVGVADAAVAKRTGVTTALGKALLAPAELAAQQRLMEAGGRLARRRGELEERLGGIAASDLPALRRAADEFAFLEKWQRQVQERLGQLM